MIISAYAQAIEPRTLQLWVGLFDTEQPPQPLFTLNERVAVAEVVAPLAPIRDRAVGASGKPCNHRGLFRFDVTPGMPYRIVIAAGAQRYELTTQALPAAVPQQLDGSFNILLCSCYSQPDDAGGLLGTIVSQIKIQPHLTLLMGDQVYLDLPLRENLPESEPGLSRTLGEKYRRNWASSTLGCAGLEPVFARAPVACIPDDHEFWNNFPFAQAQLPNTWRQQTRAQWRDAARALYEDYQLAEPAPGGGARILDIDPLKLLLIDLRCDRDEQENELMTPAALAQLRTWRDQLLAAKAQGRPLIGVLSSGQALFIAPPGDLKSKVVDAEMGNYRQFAEVLAALERLADAGIPVLYLTGDVHWGRIAVGTDVGSSAPLLYEVICSPSRLIQSSGDTLWNKAKGVFGKADPWPHHSDADPVPGGFGTQRRFRLNRLFKKTGDQVAMLTFTRSGNGVAVQATYYAIHPDKSIAKSESAEPFALRVL